MQKPLFEHKARADMLAFKIAKHRPNRTFETHCVHSRQGHFQGWQVAEVVRLPGAGFYWSGTSWVRYQPKKLAAVIAHARKPAEPTVDVTLPFVLESKAYIEVILGGMKRSFGKASILSHFVKDGFVTFVLPLSQARKRGVA